MELAIVIVIVALAAVYVGYSLYRQFTGKSGCSPGCSCSTALQHQCRTRQSLEKLQFPR